jgi:hypothetical protein
LVTIIFQVGVFGKLREKVGNKTTYRVGLFGFVIAFLLMPWVGYKDGKDGSGHSTQAGKIWLWIELGAVLIVKTVAAVGGLTSALLLVRTSVSLAWYRLLTMRIDHQFSAKPLSLGYA